MGRLTSLGVSEWNSRCTARDGHPWGTHGPCPASWVHPPPHVRTDTSSQLRSEQTSRYTRCRHPTRTQTPPYTASYLRQICTVTENTETRDTEDMSGHIHVGLTHTHGLTCASSHTHMHRGLTHMHKLTHTHTWALTHTLWHSSRSCFPKSRPVQPRHLSWWPPGWPSLQAPSQQRGAEAVRLHGMLWM